MATLRLTADLRTVEGGHLQAQLVELPGVITSTPIRDRLPDQLADALQEYLLADAPDPLPRTPENAERITVVLTLSA